MSPRPAASIGPNVRSDGSSVAEQKPSGSNAQFSGVGDAEPHY